MKRIFSIFAITAIVSGVAFTSCRDDSDYPEVETPGTIEIESRELSFPAAASQGSIVVKASHHPVTVTTDVDQPWMTATVEGNVITVSVTENTSLYGRISNLTLHSGTGKTSVSVIQSGLIFDIGGVISIGSNDDKKTFTYPVKANAGVSVSSDADWCHVSIADGELIVDLDANNTGHIRRGTIVYKVGTIEDEIPVCQCDFDKDIAGPCLLMFTTTDGKSGGFNAILARNGSKYTLDIGDGDILPVFFDVTNGAISYKAGQYIREIDNKGVTNYLYTLVWDTVSGYLTWGESIGLIAPFEYTSLSDGTPVTVGFFEDDGSWGSHVANAMRIEFFKQKEAISANRNGHYFSMIDPYIVKIHDTAEGASASLAGTETVVNSLGATMNKIPFRSFGPFEQSVEIDNCTARIVK